MRSAISWLFVICLLAFFAKGRVIQVTTNNIQLVLRSVTQLHLLLHNPKCQHSKAYADQFLELKTANNLGMADCIQEEALCKHLNVTHYPTLLLMSTTSLSVIDEDLFLLEQGLLTAEDPKVALKHILGRLRGEEGWATVVLQEEEMPIIDKIERSNQKGVFYIRNPSRLHTALYSMVGRELGCWMLLKNKDQINRYFCGTGYRSDQLEKYLQNFRKGKLQRHVFTREVNSSYLQHAELQQIVLDLGRKVSKCKMVYFYSKECEHCSLADYWNVKSVLREIGNGKDYDVQIFDLDLEEMPAGLQLPRVPELVEFCNARSYYFGDVFTLKNIKNFMLNKKTPFNYPVIAETKIDPVEESKVDPLEQNINDSDLEIKEIGSQL